MDPIALDSQLLNYLFTIRRMMYVAVDVDLYGRTFVTWNFRLGAQNGKGIWGNFEKKQGSKEPKQIELHRAEKWTMTTGALLASSRTSIW